MLGPPMNAAPSPLSRPTGALIAALSTALPIGLSTVLLLASWLGLEGADQLGGTGEPGDAIPTYSRDVRPILSDRCFTCHGFDPSERKANLRLDLRATAVEMRSSGAAFVPGDREASLAWQRIHSDDPDEAMPPAAANRAELTPAERDVLGRWIDAGAAYEEHWAFVPPVRPQAPSTGAAGHPIDRFVLAQLDAAGLELSPEAAPETRLRRLFLDLTGLPPEPEELDAFLADPSDDAYRGWIQRLLFDEPYVSRFAEHMTVPWLDAARYGDTIGIHTDNGREAWAWRDWVVNAYAANLPYDQFVIRQLAGDLLPDPSVDDLVATGFNRNHVITDEGGAINDEYLVEYAVDRVSTFGSVFQGLTLGCARCHDHKFDPVSQRDFYSTFAFFNSNDEPGLYSQEPGNPTRAFEPAIDVPTADQATRLDALAADIERAEVELAEAPPDEAEQVAAFLDATRMELGLEWTTATPLAARSTGGAEFELLEDSSVLAKGENPATDTHVIELNVQGADQRLVLLHWLEDESLGAGGIGRAANGNAVLSEIELTAAPLDDPAAATPVALRWAWADVSQTNGNWSVINTIDGDLTTGWAPAAHTQPGERRIVLLTQEPFGSAAGTQLRLTLSYASEHAYHALGRVRTSTSALDEAATERLPLAAGHLMSLGAYAPPDDGNAYDERYGPEAALRLDASEGFRGANWMPLIEFAQTGQVALEQTVGAHFLGQRFFSPSARELELSFSSDDGIQLYQDGEQVYENRVDRGVTPDSDQTTLALPLGSSALVVKVVNTGGPGGYQARRLPADGVLEGALVASLLPEDVVDEPLAAARLVAWRELFSPGYAERRTALAALVSERATLRADIPQAMVMRELAEPRPTYVLSRGAYDHPDMDQPVDRAVPTALGSLPEDLPRNRLGLAQWLFDPSNPLTARVAVNRLWAQVFGIGLVATLDDFGLQGEYPSHPKLLDWLAVEFRESGWDTKHLLELMLTSRTYGQSSRVDPESLAGDPAGRLLSRFPRQRLSAEAVRDTALYASGLLVERLGGPSVKPYQPDGLWREVAMPQSNTANFELGAGDDVWRRSLYTYWKRASPPPAMMTFDAPTREACVVERSITNTPLQALVLWNDEQFVEAARALAARVLEEQDTDEARLNLLFRRCTSREPEAFELERLNAALDDFRARYFDDEEAARALTSVGRSAELTMGTPIADPGELAAWTLIANAVLSLSETITRS